MEENYESYEKYNGKEILFRKYFKHCVVNVLELMYVLDIKGKSGRDMLRNGIPKESIITLPRDKRSCSYYLKREGVIAFLNKYKPEETEKFMEMFDKVAKQLQDTAVTEEKKELQLPANGDPYSLDLLEGILQRTEKMHREAQRFYAEAMSIYVRQTVSMLEAESLFSKVAAILLKAESIGPISRLNKDLTKDMITLGKEAFANAMACEEMLKEYDKFERGDEDEESDEADSSHSSETSGLLIRTDKKHKDNGKRS